MLMYTTMKNKHKQTKTNKQTQRNKQTRFRSTFYSRVHFECLKNDLFGGLFFDSQPQFSFAHVEKEP